MKFPGFLIAGILLSATQFSYAQQDSASVSVHFKFNKYDVSDEDKKKLLSFMSSHPNIDKLIINGHCDHVGNYPYNDRLSMRRALAAKMILLQNQPVDGFDLAINAYGKRKLLFPSDWENRVVIVTAKWKQAPPVAEAAPPVEEKPSEPVAEVNPEPQPEPAPVKEELVVTTEEVPSKTPKEIPNIKGDLSDNISNIIKQSKIGEALALRNIYFEEGRHRFVKGSEATLDALVKVMKNNPTLEIELDGHMCCSDTLAVDGLDFDTNEFKLSLNRAKAVYDYLLNNGINASRLQYAGFGARKRIVYPEKNDSDRNKNRRVELKIVKK
ncbi:MAG: OmpA family protein [Ilyomonas sp.]